MPRVVEDRHMGGQSEIQLSKALQTRGQQVYILFIQDSKTNTLEEHFWA